MTPPDNLHARIAYIVSMANGLEAFIHREVQELRARGLDIRLFLTTHRPDAIYGPEAAGWPYHRVRAAGLGLLPWQLLRGAWGSGLWREAVRHGALRELALACHYAPIMRREGIGRIHCHFGDRKLFVGYFCARLLGLPLSVTIHSHELYGNPNVELFRRALQSCDTILAVSELARRLLVDRYGAPAERVFVNRLFVDCDALDATRRALHVLMVSRFHEGKGHRYLLEAARQLAGEDLHFLIVGFGPLDVAGMIKDFGLERCITLYPKMSQEQLRFFYGRSDLFCLPSIELPGQCAEGIPVVLMEAMAAGLPVIASRIGAIAELVREILVPPGDPDALAAVICRLIHAPAERERMGRANQRIVRERHAPANLNLLYQLFRSATHDGCADGSFRRNAPFSEDDPLLGEPGYGVRP